MPAATSRYVLFAVALALSSASLSARSQAYGASARITREEFDAAQAESTVTRDQADRAAAGNTSDALEEAQGVTVQRTASGSAAPIVRGMTGYQVLLTVDQMRLNDALTRAGGHALLNLIDPESIERIEVVRGPASVVHGSDALGGYVHVTTQGTGVGPSTSADAEATAYLRGASAERAVRVAGEVSAVDHALGMRVSGGRGYAGSLLRGGDEGEQPYTGHEDWTFASRLEAAPSRAHLIRLAHQSGHLFDMPRSDTSTPEDFELTKALARDSMVLSYTGRDFGRRIRVHAYAGLSLRREFRQRVTPDEVRDERDRVMSWQAGANVNLAPWQRASLELGGNAVLEDIGSGRTSTAPGAPKERSRGRYLDGSRYDSYGLYALLTQGLGDDLTLLAGTRGTLVSARAPIDPAFPPEVATGLRLDERILGVIGSLGARYRLVEMWTWTLSLLGGFRAPNLEDFQAFGGGGRGFVVANPKLHEERSYTLETGIAHRGEQLSLETYLFASLLDGLIVRVPSTYMGMTEVEGDPVQRRENASDGIMLGGELGGRYRFESGAFAGAGAWLTWGEVERLDDAGAEVTEPASKVPASSGQIEAGWEASDRRYWAMALLTATLPQSRLSAGDRDDVRLCPDGPDACERVDGYAIASIRAGLRIDPHFMLTLGVENLLDTDYKTFASGAYAPGRNFVAAVRGTL